MPIENVRRASEKKNESEKSALRERENGQQLNDKKAANE